MVDGSWGLIDRLWSLINRLRWSLINRLRRDVDWRRIVSRVVVVVPRDAKGSAVRKIVVVVAVVVGEILFLFANNFSTW
jgi:hypothetical protein